MTAKPSTASLYPDQPKATIAPCRHCRRLVLAGWDAAIGGFLATCEPAALTAAGEAGALLDGRRTYALRAGRIDRRDSAHIIGKYPADKATVVTDHRCETLLPPDWLIPATAPPPTADNDTPPF